MLTLDLEQLKEARNTLFFWWNNIAIASSEENNLKSNDSMEDHIQNYPNGAKITEGWAEKYKKESEYWNDQREKAKHPASAKTLPVVR